MEMMRKPGEEHRKLHALAGSFQGEEKMYPSPWDPKGGSAMGKIESRVDFDGFFVVSDYIQERAGQVTYRGHGVYGYNESERGYLMHWFDSMGDAAVAPARGRWEGKTLTFEQTTPTGPSRYVYTFVAEGRYRFTIEHSQDGKQWTPFMEGSYARSR